MSLVFAEEVKRSIRAIPDFPKKGIVFRDITPLLQEADKFRACIDRLVEMTREKVDYVVSIESRGFIFGSTLAYALGSGFIPIRKAGKLPHTTFQTAYDLEYGQAVIEIHSDCMKKGSSVVIVDDVLATGGTAKAAMELMGKFDVKIVGIYFLIELENLKGRQKLGGHPVHSLVTY